MSEFETSHHLHFLFYYKTKCKFQFEIEKVAKNKSSLPEIGCFDDFVGHFYFETANFGQRILVFGHFL